MTPQQIALVQASFGKVVPIAGRAADLFYARLFEIAPDVRRMFPDDMALQKKKLMVMLGTAVNGLSRLDALLPAVHALGERHAGGRGGLDDRLRHPVGRHDRSDDSETLEGGGLRLRPRGKPKGPGGLLDDGRLVMRSRDGR